MSGTKVSLPRITVYGKPWKIGPPSLVPYPPETPKKRIASTLSAAEFSFTSPISTTSSFASSRVAALPAARTHPPAS